MDAHPTAHAGEHSHPSPSVYLKVALVLFILTALEVAAYEAGRGGLGTGLEAALGGVVVEVLLVLSAAKFALVAMFYMHLKQDPKVLSNLFVWPLVIAAGLISALIILLNYWRVVGKQ